MPTKLTITVTRPDENIPFYDQTEAWINDTELQSITANHSPLITNGTVNVTNYFVDEFTKITEIDIQDLDEYMDAVLGLPPGPLPRLEFSESKAYNETHGITVEVTEETY